MAAPSAPMHHEEPERRIPEIEVRLDLEANLVAPSILQIPMIGPQPVMAVIDGAVGGGKRGVVLDVFIASRDHRL